MDEDKESIKIALLFCVDTDRASHIIVIAKKDIKKLQILKKAR